VETLDSLFRFELVLDRVANLPGRQPPHSIVHSHHELRKCHGQAPGNLARGARLAGEH